MKKSFLIFVFTCFSTVAFCQKNTDKPIALLEKMSANRSFGMKQLSLASGNFTVSYYRCEWIINPAKNYIRALLRRILILPARVLLLYSIFPMH